MTIQLKTKPLTSFIRSSTRKKRIRIPKTFYKNGQLLGFQFDEDTETNTVKFLQGIPNYNPFEQAEGYYFDLDEWNKIIAFILNECTYPEGTLTGKPFIPEVWQSCIYANLFCWKSEKTNLRRYRECFIYVPRKNGKTTAFGAVITLIMFFTQKEQRSQSFCCAADTDQALVNFRHCQFMLENNPRLLAKLRDGRVFRSQKSFEHVNGNMFKTLSSVADTKHGLSPNFVYVDEVHAHHNSELIDVMKTGTAARREPLIVYTTTADYDRPSICNDLHKKAKDIAKGTQWQPSFLPVVYEADVTDDFESPAVWRKANPNYGMSITEEYFSDIVASVKNNPTELNRFLRLHLDIRTKTETAWIPLHVWANGNPNEEEVKLMSTSDIMEWMTEHKNWHNIASDSRFGESTAITVKIANQQLYYSWFINHVESLKDEECYGGFDNSRVEDIASFNLWFPKYGIILQWSWCPAESIHRRAKEQGIPYDLWYESGLLNSTSPNDTVDEQQIIDCLVGTRDNTYTRLLAHFRGCREVCFDRFVSLHIYKTLKEYGYAARAYPQNFLGMNEPCRRLEAMCVDRQIAHGGNPFLEWMVGNVMVVQDRDGKMRPDKYNSTNKIDGVVATLIAIGSWLHPENETITEIRGIANV